MVLGWQLSNGLHSSPTSRMRHCTWTTLASPSLRQHVVGVVVLGVWARQLVIDLARVDAHSESLHGFSLMRANVDLASPQKE